MSKLSAERLALIDTLGREVGRELSTRIVLFHQAIAERLGLNATDHKALGLLAKAGPITAGQLAELTGLTTGGVTGIIDRLEAAGFVRRERDLQDRRRVIIHTLSEDGRAQRPIFDSITQSMAAVMAQYTDEEIQVILNFILQTITVLQAETVKLQEKGETHNGERVSSTG